MDARRHGRDGEPRERVGHARGPSAGSELRAKRRRACHHRERAILTPVDRGPLQAVSRDPVRPTVRAGAADHRPVRLVHRMLRGADGSGSSAWETTGPQPLVSGFLPPDTTVHLSGTPPVGVPPPAVQAESRAERTTPRRPPKTSLKLMKKALTRGSEGGKIPPQRFATPEASAWSPSAQRTILRSQSNLFPVASR